MGANITLAGESLIAQKLGAQQTLTVSRFILANVPGLDPIGPINRAAGKPAANQIVGTYEVTQAGYVNPNQVVYSLMLGSDIGDFDWNWIGLETAENVLLMVAYVPTQQKRRNIPPQQLGNNVTRNFLVMFDGAQALTGLNIDASTWQHDFTVRLAGIDERERQSNRDFFGRACFFGAGLQLEKVGTAYRLKPGTAYVEGIRLQRSSALAVTPPSFPTTAWLDVALQRELSDVVASWGLVWGTGKADYIDSTGIKHYCIPIADLPSSTAITDRRPLENIVGPLVTHFAARDGDYEGLRARATTKDDVGLGNLPNAKSDDQNTDSSLILATTKAVKSATAAIGTAIANIISGVTIVGKAARLAVARTITLTGDVTGSVVFDGSADAIIAATGVQAAKLKTARNVSLNGDVTGSMTFDGSADASITATAVQAAKLKTPRAISLTGDVTGIVNFDGSAPASIATTANQAAKLKTARAISLTGAVTGSASFDGSAAVTIATRVGQATEGTVGGATVATQAQTNAGIDDTAYVTPRKLRWGFVFVTGQVSYIALPTWLGGLILQFGYSPAIAGNGSITVTLPTSFPSGPLCGLATLIGGTNVPDKDAMIGSISASAIVLRNNGSNSSNAAYFMVIGI